MGTMSISSNSHALPLCAHGTIAMSDCAAQLHLRRWRFAERNIVQLRMRYVTAAQQRCLQGVCKCVQCDWVDVRGRDTRAVACIFHSMHAH
jgi:hypothetical protein